MKKQIYIATIHGPILCSVSGNSFELFGERFCYTNHFRDWEVTHIRTGMTACLEFHTSKRAALREAKENLKNARHIGSNPTLNENYEQI